MAEPFHVSTKNGRRTICGVPSAGLSIMTPDVAIPRVLAFQVQGVCRACIVALRAEINAVFDHAETLAADAPEPGPLARGDWIELIGGRTGKVVSVDATHFVAIMDATQKPETLDRAWIRRVVKAR